MSDRTQPGFVFRADISGKFATRPNRFVIEADTGEGFVSVHCANPGKLTEILLPGVELLLERARSEDRKTRYTAVAAIHRNRIVPLVAERANRIAHTILQEMYPHALAIRAEVPVDSSRFDFLVETRNQYIIIEVKSCTLSEFGVAMFPDAATQRGRRHLNELAALSGSTRNGKPVATRVMFIITHGSPLRFVPHLHADPDFAITLRDVSKSVSIDAFSVEVNADGSISAEPKRVPVAENVADLAIENRGVYLAILEIAEPRDIEIGALGDIVFASGWYVYVGSAKRNLLQRTARHKKRKKRLHWHIDYLTADASSVTVFPIFTRKDLECQLSNAISVLSDRNISKFGSSDCGCNSHLHFFSASPLANRAFVDTLLEYRHVFAFD
jgi:sugar fermentation stimulation protein A